MKEIKKEILASMKTHKVRFILTGFRVGWGIFLLIVLLPTIGGYYYIKKTINNLIVKIGYTIEYSRKQSLFRFCLNRLVFLFFLTILFSCSNESSRLKNALIKSGLNNKELQKVLSHYSENLSDSLKYQAAVFLIENMNGHYSYVGDSLDYFYKIVDPAQTIEGMDHHNMKGLYEQLLHNPNMLSELKKQYDLKYITSEYLINNIDRSFETWELSCWAKELTFREFCEYILPYRVGNEILENWREDYYNHFKHLMKSKNSDCDSSLFHICESMSRMYQGEIYYYPQQVPDLKPSTNKYIITGTCNDYVNLFVHFAKSFGIPVSIDYIPQWANNAMGHQWAVVHYKDKKYDFIPGEKTHLGEHLSKMEFIYVKVYRKTFGIQDSSLATISSKNDSISHYFNNPRIIDVTHEYIPVVNLDIENLFESNHKYGYLCVFDNQNWVPIAWGKIDANKLSIENIGFPAAFLPVVYSHSNHKAIQHPIIIDKSGDIIQLDPNVNSNQEVILKRKYKDNNPKIWSESMVGGIFEFSNNRNFSNSERIIIDKVPENNFQSFYLNSKNRYKYIRYLPPDGTHGAIAEISVYDINDNEIKGNIIGNYDLKWNWPEFSREKAFDGEVLTHAAHPIAQKGAWIGLEFNNPIQINKLEYLPRNDDNFIKDGEIYELFYWDKEWISLGQQTGKKDKQYLIYKNVPTNALFLLKNYTCGKEERIFTYVDGEQVWW